MRQSLSSSISNAVNVNSSTAKKLKQNQSPRNESYKRFLRGGKRTSEKSKEVKEGKVISLSGRRGRSRKNKRFTQKNPRLKAQKQEKLKDINKIEEQIEALRITLPSKAQKPKEPEKPKAEEKPKEPEKPKAEEKPKVPKVPEKPKKPKKTRKKSKGRRVRINKKAVTKSDIDEIEKKIQAIRGKSSKDIREALEKEGIKVSGKSQRLLKDIYFYSKVCNINIQHEA